MTQEDIIFLKRLKKHNNGINEMTNENEFDFIEVNYFEGIKGRGY